MPDSILVAITMGLVYFVIWLVLHIRKVKTQRRELARKRELSRVSFIWFEQWLKGSFYDHH